MRHRWAPALIAAAIAATLAGCSASTPGHPAAHPSSTSPSPPASAPIAEPAGPPPTTLAGYYAQRLHWQSCDKVFQCARLLVPFDYHRPAWRRFSLPVIRLRATGPARRIGSLVVNPGGPGGSGISYALQARSEIAAPVRARFDIVGFDPRGVGGSEPALHCLTGPAAGHLLFHQRKPQRGQPPRPGHRRGEAVRPGLRARFRPPAALGGHA